MCTDFLTGFNAASNTIQTKYLFATDQSVVYSCETDDNSFNGTSQNPPIPHISGDHDFNSWQRCLIESTSFCVFECLEKSE